MTSSIPQTVVHIPHASFVIPGDVRDSFDVELGLEGIAAEQLRMTDAYTDELFSLPSELATTVTFPVSRLVVDPERFVDDVQESMSAKGMGAVYTRTSDGRRLRPVSFSSQQREELLNTYYYPHHNRLCGAVAAAVEQYGRCLVLDGHSFSEHPHPHESDQDPDRPDICIGTDEFHTQPWLVEFALAIFQAQGFSVYVNRPFAGTIVPEPFYLNSKNVMSIMIEIKRSLYMNEDDGQRRPDFPAFVRTIRNALTQLITNAADRRSWE